MTGLTVNLHQALILFTTLLAVLLLQEEISRGPASWYTALSEKCLSPCELSKTVETSLLLLDRL